MAKKSKEELKKTIDETIEDVDKKIAMLEDIEDSMDTSIETVEKSKYDDLESKFAELSTKYSDLQNKYKERFFSNDAPEIVKPNQGDNIDTVGLQEVNYIDIKEI